MNVAVVCRIGSKTTEANKWIPLFTDNELEAEIDTLKDYHTNSFEALEEGLKADGICVFGHG